MARSAGPALRDLHDRFGDRIECMSLYVREAHPGDDYRQPETTERKAQCARDYAERDGIPGPSRWTTAGTLHEQLDPKPQPRTSSAPTARCRRGRCGRTITAPERSADAIVDLPTADVSTSG